MYENLDIPMKNDVDGDEKIILKKSKINENKSITKYILEDKYEDISDSEEDIELGSINEFPSLNKEIIVDREKFLDIMNKKENIVLFDELSL